MNYNDIFLNRNLFMLLFKKRVQSHTPENNFITVKIMVIVETVGLNKSANKKNIILKKSEKNYANQ